MKKIVMVMMVVLGLVSSDLLGAVLTFDDISTSESASIPDGYGGFNWEDFHYINAPAVVPDSGYDNGLVSGDYVAFASTYENPGTGRILGDLFTFNGAYLTGGWRDGLNVKVDGNDQRSVIKEIQYHPLKGDIIHVDFMRIKTGQEIHLTIPLKFAGDAPGIKMGGVFQMIKADLDISTLPKYLPGEIEVDISSMEIGDTLHVSDLNLENITINHEPEMTICSIVMPKKIEEVVEEPEEGEEIEDEEAEPEVISAKSKDEESTETEG